ncbi:MAG: cytochrome c biogenesis protein CcsA [bacterium]|nr:cytochrome c biogenesis protein CcsA [bacterium]
MGLFGVLLFLVGSYLGLFWAPPERYMGEVQRIMYVHLPSAWVGLLCATFALVFAVAYLWTGKNKWDDRLVGALEVAVLLGGLLLVQGMLWGRVTWGVWWTWDVRLTTSLIMFLLFAGILALRAFVEEPLRRATWTSVATVVAYVDVPLVYFCVRWFRSLHQVQSSPETVHSAMIVPLRMNSFAVLFIAIWLIAWRARIESKTRGTETPPERRPVTGRAEGESNA